MSETKQKHVGRVLLLAVDPALRSSCTETLRKAGFAVLHQWSVETSARVLVANTYDLVILDLTDPAQADMAMLAQLRERGVDTPILLISAETTVAHASRAMRFGARGMLLLPFAAEELKSIALEMVAERRAARSRDRVAALRPALRVGQRLLGELDLPRLQAQIIETVRAELDADRASLMLLEDDGLWLRIVACSGLPEPIAVGHRSPVQQSLSGFVATHRQSLRIDDNGIVSPPAADLQGKLFEDQIVSAVCVPVLARNRVLGVLTAAKVLSGTPFSEADQELLLLLAAQAAIAIENARLYTQVAESEARYRALLQHATDAVLLLDEAGASILDANLALEQLSGYPSQDLMALSPDVLFPDLATLLAAVRYNGQLHQPLEQREIETELRTRHEQVLPVAASVSLVPHAGQQLLLVIARDISERQRISQQMVQAEKLAALGRLSASLAHEINNPLQAIHNSVHLMRSRPLTEEKRQIYLSMTQDEIERLISIVQRMLDFYRPSREGMRPVEINDILDAVLTLIENQVHTQGVRIEREGALRLPRIFAISNHMKQVCFNLIFNALEAMPDGGILYVRTYLIDADTPDMDDASYIAVSGSQGRQPPLRPAVVVEISDTGAGIAASDLPKIFEPFYTTRTKGTGLGLAVSYSIIEQHHGQLAVRSEVGKGTTFRMKLPVAE